MADCPPSTSNPKADLRTKAPKKSPCDITLSICSLSPIKRLIKKGVERVTLKCSKTNT